MLASSSQNNQNCTRAPDVTLYEKETIIQFNRLVGDKIWPPIRRSDQTSWQQNDGVQKQFSWESQKPDGATIDAGRSSHQNEIQPEVLSLIALLMHFKCIIIWKTNPLIRWTSKTVRINTNGPIVSNPQGNSGIVYQVSIQIHSILISVLDFGLSSNIFFARASTNIERGLFQKWYQGWFWQLTNWSAPQEFN